MYLRQPRAVRGFHRQSEAIRGTWRAMSDHQRPSEAISDHQRASEGTQRALIGQSHPKREALDGGHVRDVNPAVAALFALLPSS